VGRSSFDSAPLRGAALGMNGIEALCSG